MSTAFRVVLDGSQETPPNDSTATGLGTVTFDSDAVTATYSIRIEGLDFGPATGAPPQTPETDDDVTNAHFHNEVRGVAGPVVFGQIAPAQDNDDLTIVQNADAVAQNADGSWTVSGRWDMTDPANVSIANFADDLGSAAVGSEVPLYYNVHTSLFPAGEIRGQLVAIADDSANVVTGTAGDDLLPGLGGNDVIFGFTGNDTIDGGPGDDILSGGQGADTFIFRNNEVGNDTISDFNPAEDHVQLAGFDPSFNPLEALSTRALGTELDLGSGNSVLFVGLTPAEFNADDFQIV
jgi:Ca2+-binding RTX toxin-like protein